MTDKLTAKQEKFAREVVKCGNQSEAYRKSYNVGKNTKISTVNVKASQLMAKDKIRIRVEELQAKANERCIVTVESLTAELEEARAMAMKEGQAAAMTGASMGKARLHGLDVRKIDMNVSDNLADRVKAARDRAAGNGEKDD